MSKQARIPKPTVPLTPDRLWTINEVAYYLSIGRVLVYTLINAGELPFVKVGERFRFRPSEIEAWLRAHQSSSTSQ